MYSVVIPLCSLIPAASLAACALAQSTPPDPTTTQHVGPAADQGGTVITTGQLVRPAGKIVEFTGRPVDIALSPDGKTLYAKDNRGLVVVDVPTWTVKQEESFGDDGPSMTGIILSRDGRKLWASDCNHAVREFAVSDDGKVLPVRPIALKGPGGKGAAYACGLALSPDESHLYVCLSRENALGIIRLSDATLESAIPVGIAPFGVKLSKDGTRAWVSCWGGDQPHPGDLTATTSGTKAKVDARGISASGGAVAVDLAKGERTAYIETGLSACSLVLSSDQRTLYVANANSDTVSVIDTAAARVTRSIVTRPVDNLPFGSMPCALALSPEGKHLYTACAGNNAIAIIDVADEKSPILGWIPTGWYPGALAIRGSDLFIANVKGVGSRTARKDGNFNTHKHRGTLQAVEIPGPTALESMSARVSHDARLPQALTAVERRDRATDVSPVAIPANPGDPSTIEHIIYIIKENRTYDQTLGDLAAADHPRGNGDPKLCIYGREVTPNIHAIVEQFVLLDNWYCNGVLSADGHSWATEGNSTPYLERSFGGFKRSYTYGDDPLTYSSSGFIWDHVLAAGMSYLNFGEFDEASIVPASGGRDAWTGVWEDRQSGRNAYTYKHSIGVDNVRRHSDPDYPGWNLDIPDQVRADIFIRKLGEMDKAGSMPNFITMHLPQDHTAGVSEGVPTPRAYVADNDLAVGRIVEAVSKSSFWPKTAVFIVEDDPQDGWDHVDGHRSVCIVASPWTKRNAVVSEFYNQASVVHTIEHILGLTAQNQLYAAAPVMTTCFTDKPDYSPFIALAPNIKLDELSPPKKPKITGPSKPGDGQAPPSQKGVSSISTPDLYELTAKQNLTRPDQVNDKEFNLVLWHAAKGDEPYPKALSGAHAAGLAALGLIPDDDDDDDDDK